MMHLNLNKILKILIIVALLLISLNQLQSYWFKQRYVYTPCDLCKEYNQEQSMCIDDCFKIDVLPTGQQIKPFVLNLSLMNFSESDIRQESTFPRNNLSRKSQADQDLIGS